MVCKQVRGEKFSLNKKRSVGGGVGGHCPLPGNAVASLVQNSVCFVRALARGCGNPYFKDIYVHKARGKDTTLLDLSIVNA